jgi:GAF domain-containing protein
LKSDCSETEYLMSESDFSSALADGPNAIFELIARRLKASPGYDLLTVLAPVTSRVRLDRLYSTNHGQYPLGAADEVEDNGWFRQLFSRKQAIVANTLEEIGEWIPDYAIFIEQNYDSLLNLPVVFAGRTVGLINIMAGEGHFGEAALAEIRSILPLAAVAILGSSCKPVEIEIGR